MDITNNNVAFWIAGYADYLRDVVGAADTTPAGAHMLRHTAASRHSRGEEPSRS